MAKFQAKQAKREKIYPKIALMAPSGGGKTFSALRLATGMSEYMEKMEGRKARILFANTEAKRGYYYANEFTYDIVDLTPPHNPENYVDLIEYAIEEDYDILILDSSSHEWEGKGGCLELQQQAGGKYQDWAKVTPRHQKFIDSIAYSPITIIATMRSKDAYEMEKDGNGRTSVSKVGVGAKQREGFEYEFSATFLIDQKTNTAVAQKDNTHIFSGEGSVLLSENHGYRIMDWANTSTDYAPMVYNIDKEATKKAEVLANTIEDIKGICKDAVANGTDKEALNAFIAENNGGKKNFTTISDIKKAEELKVLVENYLKEEKGDE